MELLRIVLREDSYLPGFSLLPVFFFGQQKPCQAITSFIDAWAILSFGTDVASQETIIQRAILNTWITPQLHTLLTGFHVVILKCKDGPWEKNTEPGRNLNGEMPKLPRRKRSILLWERWLHEKPNGPPLDFVFFYLQNQTLKTQSHERISFHCVDVYIVLNISRRNCRWIRCLVSSTHVTIPLLVAWHNVVFSWGNVSIVIVWRMMSLKFGK